MSGIKRVKYENVVVLSGGLDSLVLLYKLIDEGKNIRALYIDYKKPVSNKEIASVKLITQITGTPLEIVDLGGISTMQNGYAPTEIVNRDECDVKGTLQPVPDSTYQQFSKDDFFGRADKFIVSGFHSMLSTASFYAQLIDIENVSFAVIKNQFDAHSQLKKSLESFQDCVRYLNDGSSTFSIDLPFEKLSKVDVVTLGNRLSVPFQLSWSCLHGYAEHCGECSQCISRKEAFKSANVADPTKYEN